MCYDKWFGGPHLSGFELAVYLYLRYIT